jgi:branched-chain amino acid aminotransferase
MSSALHYATECFEGMKAYRGFDGKLRLFRPQRNCERMLKSATRIALPGFEPRELQKLIERFVALDGPRWLPRGRSEGSHLYLRPTMIGTGDALGVQKPTEALLFVIAVCFPPLDEPRKATTTSSSSSSTTALPQSLPSLAGVPTAGKSAEKKEEEKEEAPKESKSPSSNGMRLLASRHDMIRAWPGGFGHAKVGANYGPSLVAQQEARQKGYHQILWLFGDERHVTEAGASNFFVLWRTKSAMTTREKDEVGAGEGEEGGHLQLVTAPLGDGVILDGVTRASVLELARQRWRGQIEVVERPFTMGEVVQAGEEGRLVEAFGCGTAFFVAPVADIHFGGRDVALPLKSGVEATYAMCLKAWLREIMFGRVQHEWGVVVEEEEQQEQ